MRIEKEINIGLVNSYGWNLSNPIKFSYTLEVIVFGVGVIGIALALDHFFLADEYNSYPVLRYSMIISLICGLIYGLNIASNIIYYEFKFIRIFNNSIYKLYKNKDDSVSKEIMRNLDLGGVGVIPLIQDDKINVKYIPMSIIPYHEIFKVYETVIYIIIKQSVENTTGVSTTIIIGPVNKSTYDYILRIIKILSNKKTI